VHHILMSSFYLVGRHLHTQQLSTPKSSPVKKTCFIETKHE
jgi:hypothetical protein